MLPRKAGNYEREEAVAKQEYARRYGRVPSTDDLGRWLPDLLREFAESEGRQVRDLNELVERSRRTAPSHSRRK